MIGNALAQLFFGFPAGVISLLLSAFAIKMERSILLIIASVLTIPFTFYLTTASGLPLYLIALFQFGAAYAVTKQKIGLAWGLLIPLALTTLFMAYLTFFTFFKSLGL